MCPAFGAVRNLLRMEDAMPIVISSGDGCLYGHTFVAHFYVANRPVHSPGVSSEIWAKGSAFDELRSMVCDMAERHEPANIPICSLCVSDTVGLPFDLLPKQIGNTEVIYVPLPAYSVHTHARAKDIVVDSLVWRLPPQRKARSGVNLIGEIFPSDPIAIDELLRRMGTHVNTHVPGPRWADYVAMGDGALNAPLHPFYSESVKRMRAKQGLPFVEGAPVGIDGTYRWITAIGAALAANDKPQAETWLRQALDRYPKDPAILSLAARFEQARGDNQRATEYYRAALAAMPPTSRTDRLAHILVYPEQDTKAHRAMTAADLQQLLDPNNEPFAKTTKLPPLPKYGQDPYEGTAPVRPAEKQAAPQQEVPASGPGTGASSTQPPSQPNGPGQPIFEQQSLTRFMGGAPRAGRGKSSVMVSHPFRLLRGMDGARSFYARSLYVNSGSISRMRRLPAQ